MEKIGKTQNTLHPWGDDIDVSVKRDDYTIFMEKGQALLTGGLFFQNRKTGQNYKTDLRKLGIPGPLLLKKAAKTMTSTTAYTSIFSPWISIPMMRPLKKLEKQRTWLSRYILTNFRLDANGGLKY